MDIIQHLQQVVTPQVAPDNTQAQGVLRDFYAIYTANLATHSSNVASHDMAFSTPASRSGMIEGLAEHHGLSTQDTESLISAAAPLTFEEISTQAGSQPAPVYLQDHKDSIQAALPAWALALLPTKTAAAPADSGVLMREEKEQGSLLKTLIPIILLILLALLAWWLLRSCQPHEEQAVAPVADQDVIEPQEPVIEQIDEGQTDPLASIEAEPAVLKITTGEGATVYACNAWVGDESLQNQISSAITDVMGSSEKCHYNVTSSYAEDMAAVEPLPEILQLLKDTPDASAEIKGTYILLNAPNNGQLSQLVTDVQAVVPNFRVEAAKPLDIELEVKDSAAVANELMDRIDENEVNVDDLIRALNTQIINFELDKAIIPEVNKQILDRAANLVQKVPNVKLDIIGHTDSLASDSYNQALSMRRSEAVKEYLVAQGVSADNLITHGRGESDPIADNSTELGRFRNRRIEFKVLKEGEVVAEVTPETANDDTLVISPEELEDLQ